MAKEHETNLGRFIRSNRRQDGTDHVFMSVPDHLCPPGWPKTITLPSEGKARGSLEDPVFLAKVRREAEVLNARLDQRRLEEEIYRSEQRNARALANIYFKTQRFRDVSEARQYRNKRDAMLFVNWAERRGDPDFATLRKPDFEDFLALYDNRPSQKLELRSTLNILCTEAMEAGWRTDNPISRIPWTVPKPAREVVLWTDETAHRFAQMAALSIGCRAVSPSTQPAWAARKARAIPASGVVIAASDAAIRGSASSGCGDSHRAHQAKARARTAGVADKRSPPGMSRADRLLTSPRMPSGTRKRRLRRVSIVSSTWRSTRSNGMGGGGGLLRRSPRSANISWVLSVAPRFTRSPTVRSRPIDRITNATA